MGDWSEWRFLKWRNTDGSQTMCIQACACMIWLCSCGCVHSQEHVYMSVFVHFRAEVDLHFSFNIENFIYPPTSREHRRKGVQKTLIHSCRMGKSAVETVWLLHAWTHCCCGYLHHILLNPSSSTLPLGQWTPGACSFLSTGITTMCLLCLGFTLMLELWTPVFMLPWQAFYKPSHLSSTPNHICHANQKCNKILSQLS